MFSRTIKDPYERFEVRLTDAYAKGEGTNVDKLARVSTEFKQVLLDSANRIYSWRDIDEAEGKILDAIGRNYAQIRGSLPDEMYRIVIKAKIMRARSSGTIENIIDLISFILQIPYTDIDIQELYETTGEPAAAHIQIPVAAISKTGLTVRQFGTLVDMSAGAGVRITALFEGTFSFASGSEPEPSSEGFADLAQTVGGTLGFAYDPAEHQEIPD